MRYIALGSGADIVSSKNSKGEVLRYMRCHTGTAACTAFAAGGKENSARVVGQEGYRGGMGSI